MQSSEAFQQAFTPAELQMDYDMLLGRTVAGVLIWWVERQPDARATAA